MKKISSRQTTVAAVFLLLLLLLAAGGLIMRQNKAFQISVSSGHFRSGYASVMQTLQTQTRLLDEKIRTGLDGSLELTPEKLLTSPEPEPGPETEQTADTLPVDPGEIKLRGIYWSESMPLAEINRKLYKPGETVAGFVLEEIQPYHIVLMDPDGNRITYSLIKEL
jgi:hypothetical protein